MSIATFGALAGARAATLPSALPAQAPIAAVSGGVTEEERERMSAMAGDYNLKIVLATRSGAYLADVAVVVRDGSGQPVLAAKAEGPWVLARLPAGRYSIEGSTNGTTVRKAVAVGGGAQARVDLRWDD
jgi:hypothetical protein